MRYYPVFLDLNERPVAVVGGGEVAERKVLNLLSAGARIRVVSPALSPTLEGLLTEGLIGAEKRPYREGDLRGVFLAVSASDSREVNDAVFKEASSLGILVNVVDDPERCNFVVPSIVERGGLLIAISTSGKVPYLSKTVRLELEKRFGPEYGPFVDLLGAVRQKLLKEGLKGDKKDKVIKSLVSSSLPSLIKDGQEAEIDRCLKELAGEGYSLAGLGIKMKG